MKYKITLLVLLFAFFANAQSKQWTLQECIEYAFENNLTIKQNELALSSAAISKDVAMANLLPNLNLGAGYFWQFGFSIDPITNVRRAGNRQTSSVTLSSQWVIFDGMQNYNQISKARLDYMASLYNLDAIKNDISLNIASAYLQILLNRQVLEVAENQLLISKGQLERNQKLFEAGSIPKGDYLQVEAQFAADEQSVVAAENNENISRLQLAQLLQLPTYNDFDIVTPEFQNSENTLLQYSPQQIFDIALGNQPIIKNAEINVQSAEKQVSISKGGYAPVLSLSGQINSNAAGDRQRTTETINGYLPIGSLGPGTNRYVFALEPQDIPIGFENYPFFDQFGDNLNQFIGINLQVPIFNRLSVRSSVQSSELQLQQNLLNLETQKNNLRQTIERAYTDAMAGLKNYNAAVKSLEANQESWDYAQKRFEQGGMNIFDYDNTRSRYLNAVAQMLRSKYDYIFKVKVLEFYLTNNITL